MSNNIPAEVLQDMQNDGYKLVTPQNPIIVQQSNNGQGSTRVLFSIPDDNVDKVMKILRDKCGLDPSQLKLWYTDDVNKTCQRLK